MMPGGTGAGSPAARLSGGLDRAASVVAAVGAGGGRDTRADLGRVDTTIVNVALDTLSRELHSPLSSIQWVSTGYLLSLAAVIPLTGLAYRTVRLQAHMDRLDRFGRGRLRAARACDISRR
jgi:MFS family permease